ncbi:hypothetical protein OEZ85_010129 [Tetradesmus obliquus]|uniref:Uncharacterized protein n=1 Tax=Tetradesmus obliquus TaxID=3088 RepID=A0ABY8TLN6_TETOB|nr:hypothetical protein OEZ85_010129 [Tetradesmus obliquus]
MDTLRGIPEHIEAEFGDSIVARDEAVALLGEAPGLGPPDLCWLQKAPKGRSLLGGSAEAQGYYHFVLGRDACSTAAVAAYFALLNSKVEPAGMLQGLWSPEFVIQRGFYCCYDALSCMDLRCELCVPGGVLAGCVDAAGVLHDATPQHFMQAQVCGFIRAMLYDPELRAAGGSVIAYEPCPSAAAERSLLSCVLALYQLGALPGALQDIYAQQGCGVLPEHMDVALAALWQHFRRRQRWAAAASFFRQLAAVYPAATLLWGAAQRCLGLGGWSGSSGNLLAELLLLAGHRGPEQLCPATLVGLATECLEAGRVQEAAVMARQALQASPRCRPAWLLLAQCFIAQRQFAAALVALNVVPTPPLPAAEVELLHVAPPPPPKATTQPQARLYDGELEAVRCCAAEEASLHGSRLLAYLPGCILVNREPLGAGLLPDTSPNRITRAVLAAVYALLQDIVSQTSWDEFLEIRSRVFLMQHEATPRASQDAAQQRSERQSKEQQQQQQQQQQQEGVVLAAALQQKLEQLGLQVSGSGHIDSAGGLVLHRSVEPPSSEEPAVNGTQPHAEHPGPAAAAVIAHPSPPSRGRLSSSGGQKGSPKSYYASRLQEELAKPGTSGALPRSSTPGEGQGERSMAGRVLLLGRSQARRVSSASSRTPPGAAGSYVFSGDSAPTGCGVPRSLAPNEVEDLSRLATASKVAPIRTQGSITPQLWDVVFGAARSPPASGSRRALHYQQQQDAAEAFTSNAALPRIKTRPLGEAREQQCSFNGCRDSAGEAVSRSLEADRERLMAGWIADDASAEAAAGEGAPARRLCVRWLDELIVALWHDLQAYMEWKVWDQTLREARGGSHAELVLGLVPEQAGGTPRTPLSDGGNINPPALTSTDWMRRGALAERLGHVSDARAAYRAAVKLGFSLAAYSALLRLEAGAGNVSDAVLCAAQVMAWQQQRLAQGGSSSGSSSSVVRMGVPPELVTWGLGLAASSSSADELLLAAARAPNAAAELKAVLHEWSKWQQVAVPEPLQPQQEAGLQAGS